MKILIVEPRSHPRVAEISGSLKSMQETVGGYIQAIYPFEDAVALVCDEEGLLKECEWNRVICENCAIKGTFFICGAEEDDLTDLPDDLVVKYEQRFYAPEVFFMTPQGIRVIRL